MIFAMLAEAIEKAERLKGLSRAEAEAVAEELLSGRVETPEIVRLLAAMRARDYAVDEVVGFATVMRRHAQPVFTEGVRAPEMLVDTCGTGGDGSDTFNISTAAAFVVAGAGGRVAKHGTRSVSSRCGSADVLEALGAQIQVPFSRMASAIQEVGIGFLFAMAAHTAMHYAMPARKQLGGRTIFNLLGPLTNPAGASAQVLGVFSADVVELEARALAELGTRRAFVVHGEGGLDEISLRGETKIAEVREGSVRVSRVVPEDFGVGRAPMQALRGGNPPENAVAMRQILEGETGARRDVVLINAAAALVAAGIAEDFREGAALAGRTIDSGAARDKLAQFVSFTNG
ncbi:MAG TPA: anthranilate phosphoribosyltransferase [Candidatus Acidoferrales bacterium]|nr:anthranilate phosphoribosyltransferase [Candidatus Acidoferrales bacterium]